jgi:hypothetical protein
MTDPIPLQVPPVAVAKSQTLKPTWAGAWRGIWLFTWRSQLSWQRLPVTLALLLVLPLLVYLTTLPRQSWSRRFRFLGNPRMQVSVLATRLTRADGALQPQQQVQLLRIFEEEFARTEEDWPSMDSAEANIESQKAQIKTCYQRIHLRVRPVLDDSQFAVFQTFESREVQLRQERIREPAWGRTGAFYHWLIDFYFFVVLPLNCVRACGALIRDELQADTLGFLVTRPMSRARLLVLKYLAQTTWLQLVLLLETLLLFVAGSLRQIPNLNVLLPLFLAAQVLAVPAWSALGLFFGQVTNRYMAMAVVYGLIVEMGIGRIPTNINTLSLMRHLKTLLSHNPALQTIYEWSAGGVPLAVAALVLAPVLFLTAAALLFTFREYHPTAEMQK